MGTNFYWIDQYDKDAEWDVRAALQCHIGKRSAAGVYCWDCGTTLHKEGTSSIHEGFGKTFADCPVCHKEYPESKGREPLGSAVNLELFGERPTARPKGVETCCSFTWTMMSHKWKLEKLRKSRKKVVINEYGDKFTAAEFLDKELLLVTIEFQLPVEFS